MTFFKNFIKKENIFENKNYGLSMPYIIAEIGVNHEGCIENAKKMIYQAKIGGAHAVKFQSYKAEKLASKNSPAYWDTTKEKTLSQFDLFKKHDKFGQKEFELLYEYSNEIGIDFSSTPFDIESANYLNNLCEFFKISSSDITNHPFINHICRFGKPIILSTGASTIEEISETVNLIKSNGNKLILLHCVLNYPTEDKNANLGVIQLLKENFKNVSVGYSDHTMPGEEMKVCEVAHILGAEVIEKHFTFDKKLKGNDHYHAMDLNDLKLFVNKLKSNINIASGQINLESQQSAIQNARRSLYYSKKLKKNHILLIQDIEIKRPASGMKPSQINSVIGKKLICDVDEDTIIETNHLEKV